MPSTRDEISKEYDDIRHQAFVDWRERYYRVEEQVIKTKEQIEKEEAEFYAECLKTYIEHIHNFPECHFRDLARELRHEMFCLMNGRPYEPTRFKNGHPGYWDYRAQNAETWILKTRERLPDE